MKSINFLQKILRSWGLLGSSSANPRRKSFDLIWNCLFFGISIIFFLRTFWFVVTAQTVKDIFEGLMFLFCSCLVISWFVVYISQKNATAILFDDLSKIIEQRELKKYYIVAMILTSVDFLIILGTGCKSDIGKRIYTKIDETSIKWIDFMTLALFKIAMPLFVIPPALISAIKYITSDNSRDSFQQVYLAT